MHSTSAAQPRLRVSRQSGFSQWPGTGHHLQMPQAGPSRVSSQLNAPDTTHENDDDSQATPRVATRPGSDPFTAASADTTTGTARLRAIMAKEYEHLSRRTSPPSPRPAASHTDADLTADSDFGSPHATIAQSQHAASLRELFSAATADLTPRHHRWPIRRNSIDLSEVEDSPRGERVREERAVHKGKRRSASDEEVDGYAKSVEGSEISRYASSAAKFGALQDRLDSSLRTPKAPLEPSRATTLALGKGMSGAEELLALEPPTDVDIASETSGDTAKILRHLDREAATSTPVGMNTTMRSLQMPLHFNSQSNLLDQNSDMEKMMNGPESETESVASQPIPFPPSKPNGRDPSPEPTSRAHGKSHTAHNLPLPRRVSIGGRDSVSSSRSSSFSAAEFQDRLQGDDRDKLHERERQWNKPNGRSPGLPRTPESGRRISQGSPSYGRRISQGSPSFATANGGSPSQRMLSRRSSSASMQGFRDGRNSINSSISSQADYNERMAEMEYDKNKERERLWNKPQPRRSSSSMSLNSPGERSRTNSSSSRPESAQSYDRVNGRPTSWHQPDTYTQNFYLSSPSNKEGVIVQERERNWNSPHPKWEYQVPRSLSPLPPPPDAPGSGYGKPPADWDPNKSWEGPSRSRHNSFTRAAGRRTSFERSRTTSLNDEVRPSQGSLRRTSTDGKIDRAHSPAFSETGGQDMASHFGWSFPKRRANLPPFSMDSDSPQRRPSTPESRSPGRLSARPSLIPIRSPGRRDDVPTPPKSKDETHKSRGQPREPTPAVASTSTAVVVSRSRIDPKNLMNEPIMEDLVPTDIESGSDRESQVSATPLAVPVPLPPSNDPGPGPSSLSQSTVAQDEGEGDTSEFPSEYRDTFVTAVSPELSPVREDPPETIFGLSTPPRRPFLNTSRMEFETPSPPRNMPDLPGPPSSEEDDDDDLGVTPINARVSLLADFTAAKTPKPPGAWAATPVPVEKVEEVKVAKSEPVLPPEADGPVAAPANTVANNTLSGIPTPAPPGAWQATPGSARRKSILKVRFEGDTNTSGESMPEIPMIGPADPADSMSEVFPPVVPLTNKAVAHPEPPTAPSPVEDMGRPSSARTRPKSLGLRLMDAFGREAVEPPILSATSTSSTKSDEVESTPSEPPAPPVDTTPRSKSLVRMVDAMGREVVDDGQSGDDSSTGLPPTSRGQALLRIRETLSQMADDLGESDDSRVVSSRHDEKLNELYKASQAARSARKGLVESLQRQRAGDPTFKIGSKGQLLSTSRFSIDFLNTWVLWVFFILQVVLLFYMYRLSIIRAKQIFLTTYYDAFSPDLFSHLSKTQTVQQATPPTTSPTPSPFSITDALTRDGWKGVLAEAWARTIVIVAEWQNYAWDVWGQHPGRTNAWPPT